MKAYIKPNNEYYEGDREAIDDIEVSQRPSYLYRWDGKTWAVDPNLMKLEEAQKAKEQLKEIDLNCIRALRGVLISIAKKEELIQADVDKLLGDEQIAKTLRGAL